MVIYNADFVVYLMLDNIVRTSTALAGIGCKPLASITTEQLADEPPRES
jgi:hypothetical protein